MNSWSSRPGFAFLLLGGLGLVYPFAVYLSLGRIPAGVLVCAALALVAGRLLGLRRTAAARALVPALLLVCTATACLALAGAEVAALAYPVIMNLGFSAAFGLSLVRPPSLVECFAALSEPSPGPAARTYMRRVSLVWCLFLAVNAGISLLTLLSGDRALWALYNGLISYLLMGCLFAAEYTVRRRVRAREAEP